MRLALKQEKYTENPINLTPTAPPEEPLYAVPEGVTKAASDLRGSFDFELDPADQAELKEQAAHYHDEESPWNVVLNLEQNSTSALVFRKLRQLLAECVKCLPKNKNPEIKDELLHLSPAYPPSVIAGLDPPPPIEIPVSPPVIAGACQQTTSISSPVWVLSPLQKAL